MCAVTWCVTENGIKTGLSPAACFNLGHDCELDEYRCVIGMRFMIRLSLMTVHWNLGSAYVVTEDWFNICLPLRAGLL